MTMTTTMKQHNKTLYIYTVYFLSTHKPVTMYFFLRKSYFLNFVRLFFCFNTKSPECKCEYFVLSTSKKSQYILFLILKQRNVLVDLITRATTNNCEMK